MRRTERLEEVARRVALVKADFRQLVADYDVKSPFRRAGQLESHRRTIAARRSFASARAALADDSFFAVLHGTLPNWGIGRRASHLVDLPAFTASPRRCAPQIEALEGFTIDDPHIDVAEVGGDVMLVIKNLEIVANEAKLVACSKNLHHLLPELVVPIDRKFTHKFFLWPGLQSHQGERFIEAFAAFADIARAVNPQRYVPTQKWHTSRTKVTDNAIVSFVEAIRKQRGAKGGVVQERNPADAHKTADSFRAALAREFEKATAAGQKSLRISAGELHRIVGGYPGPDHSMPVCCRVMKSAMTGDDRVLESPPSGQGPSLTIEYRLPR